MIHPDKSYLTEKGSVPAHSSRHSPSWWGLKGRSLSPERHLTFSTLSLKFCLLLLLLLLSFLKQSPYAALDALDLTSLSGGIPCLGNGLAQSGCVYPLQLAHIKTIPLRHSWKPPLSKQSLMAVPRDLPPRCGVYIGLYGWENGLFWNNVLEMTSAMEDEDDPQVSHIVKEV